MSTKHAKVADRLLAILGASFVIIVGLLPFHAFISTWGGTAVGPLLVWKSWKEVLLLALVPIVIWLCLIRPDIRKGMWRSWLNRLIALYVLVSLIMVIGSPASIGAVIAGLLMNLRFFAMFVLGEILLLANPAWLTTLKQWLVPWLLGVSVLISVLAILQVTVIPRDFLTHFGYDKDTTIAPYVLVDQNQGALRAFSTMRGPNTLAAYLLLPLAMALVLWWQNKKQWLYFGSAAIMTVAMFLTGSRSAWLGAAAMLVLLGFTTLPREKLTKWLKYGTVPVLAVVVLLFWLATFVPSVRLAVFHSGGTTQAESLLEGSSDKHWQATMSGIQEIVNDPLGQGIGTAGPASFYNTNGGADIPEDYYVQVGEETGIFGLTLFVVICVMVWRKLWQQRHDLLPRVLLASFLGISVINLFLHGWADDPTAMTWWGVAGLFIAKQK